MMLYSFNGCRPEPLPFRITLPNGFTRTDPSTFTEAEITAAGFTGPYTEPAYDPITQQIDWMNGTYAVVTKPPAPPKPKTAAVKRAGTAWLKGLVGGAPVTVASSW